MVVEHRDPVRGNWHRALVKRVDMLHGKVHLLLVDWGNVVVVPWSNLRILTENFTRLESQVLDGFRCKTMFNTATINRELQKKDVRIAKLII